MVSDPAKYHPVRWLFVFRTVYMNVSANARKKFKNNSFNLSLRKILNEKYNEGMKLDDLRLSENLKNMRLEKNMSQWELSRKSGVTQATISRIESGQEKNVQLVKIVGLCNALDCSVYDLLSDSKVSGLLSGIRDYFLKK